MTDTWTTEPPLGSVVLMDNETGTAWQRHHSDGLWHSTTGRYAEWDEIRDDVHAVLHLAPPREGKSARLMGHKVARRGPRVEA